MRIYFNIILLLLSVITPKAYALQQDTITLLFVGDIMQHMPQVNSAYNNGSYNYEPCFSLVKNEISNSNVSLCNLEVPLAGKPYTGYPQFSAPDDIASALKNAGFNILVTANNHSCDKSSKGIKRTIKVLDSLQLRHTGIFLDSMDRRGRYPLIFTEKNIRFALLNYTYGTNGIPVPQPFVVNLIDTAQISKDILEARKASPDVIIAFLHWGVEYARLPNQEQKDLAEFLIKKGVNLVIGSHPHVMQPMEKRYSADGRSNAVIVYSLGNFVSNQSQPNTDGGAMARITLVKDTLGTRIHQAAYSLVWVYKPTENGKKKYYILPAARYENDSDFIDAANLKKLKTFLKNSRELFNSHNIGFCEYKF